MNTCKLETLKPRMIAHRGVSGLERENTCAAFVAAGNRGYFGIETDVHLTADGQYVIIHDDTTGEEFKAVAFPPFINRIIEHNGLLSYLKARQDAGEV